MRHAVTMTLLSFLVFAPGQSRSSHLWQVNDIKDVHAAEGSTIVPFKTDGKHLNCADYALINGRCIYQPEGKAERYARLVKLARRK